MGDRLSRRKRKDGSQFVNSWFQILLCQQNTENRVAGKVYTPINYVCSSVSTNDQVVLEIKADNLKNKGKYFLVIEALWNKQAVGDYQAFCVQLLAKSQIDIKEV